MNFEQKILSIAPETKTRVITAVAGVSLLLILLIFGGHFGASVVTIGIAALMCMELSKVFYHLSDKEEKTKVLLGTAWLVIFINLFLPKSGLESLVCAFIGIFSYFLAVADRHADKLKDHFNELIYTVFILVYVVMFMSFLPLVRRGPNGLKWLFLFLLINWAGDSIAYFAGRKYGKRKLYPLVSPNKTLEGALGGLAGSMFVALLFKFIFFRELSVVGALFTALFVGVFAQIGDLCESLFKRSYGVKDTGNILPGHGGILDRFDGVLFTLPVMYLCVLIFS